MLRERKPMKRLEARRRLAEARLDKVWKILKEKLNIYSKEDFLHHAKIIKESLDQGRNIDWKKVSPSIAFLQNVHRGLGELLPQYVKEIRSCKRVGLIIARSHLDQLEIFHLQYGEVSSILEEIESLRKKEQN